ncbi:MAG TPA: extracellular solute-binding protein, partial [Actinomycetota bacterium]|nr:extracellular solute-binding protein [Actinomycetota bacterium]
LVPMDRVNGQFRFVYDTPKGMDVNKLAIIGKFSYICSMPFAIDLSSLKYSDNTTSVLFNVSCPVSDTETKNYFIFAREKHDDADWPHISFNNLVFAEDKPIIESESPQYIPDDEVSVVTDKVSTQYRKWLRELEAAAKEGKEAFKKAGVSVPATLADLKSSCKALSNAGYTPIAFGNQYGWPAIHFITQFNAQFVPADVRTADYNPAGGAFTDPGYEKALATFKDLVDTCSKPGSNGISHETAQAELTNGKAAMQYLEVLEFVNLEDKTTVPEAFRGNWDQFVMPPVDGGGGTQTAITGAPDGFLVNAQSQNLDLAVDFLKFLTSKTNAAELTKVIGWPSPIQGATTSDNASAMTVKAVEEIQKAGELAIWLDTETNAEVAQAYLAGVEGLLNGDETPASVMEKVRTTAAKVKAEA